MIHMKNRILFAITLIFLTLSGVILVEGKGLFSTKTGATNIHNLIQSPVKLLIIDQQTGCDPSATSSNCAATRNSQPTEQSDTLRSTSTSYAEVASTEQSGKIDDHLTVNDTLKNISFCGNLTLKTRQILINGVDVGQRIAQLASDDLMGQGVNNSSIGEGVCGSMPHNIEGTRGILEIPDVIIYKTTDPQIQEDMYYVVLGALRFAINPETNEIFIVSAYDGSTLTAVGKLK